MDLIVLESPNKITDVESYARALGLDVLRLDGDHVIEITRFVTADSFPAFGLPITFRPTSV